MVNIITSKTRAKSRADMAQVHERRKHVEQKIGRKLWTGDVEVPKPPPLKPPDPLGACERMEKNMQQHHVKVNRTEATREQKAAIKKRVREEIAPRVERRQKGKKNE